MNGEEERKRCVFCEKIRPIESFGFDKWTNEKFKTCMDCKDIKKAIIYGLIGIDTLKQ